ncbi:MAG: nucleoside triphosphate pyrophosphatase [Gammaproteobacteria bacterium]
MNQSLVILASASPRRAELLGQIGVTFEQRPSDVDESHHIDESPEVYVQRLATAKAEVALAKCNDCVVIGSDTVVTLGGVVLGKPIDEQDHADVFAQLSGRTHDVLTAVTVMNGKRSEQVLSRSSVTFAEVSAADIARYWRTGEPADKAGGYAIQGMAALFITHLTGSYSGVMGLPVRETATLLAQFGVIPWLNKE